MARNSIAACKTLSVMLLLAWTVISCSGPAGNETGAAGQTTPATEQAGGETKPATEPQPAATETASAVGDQTQTPAAPAIQQLLKDGEFTNWKDGLPGWNRSPFAATEMKQSEETRDGKPVAIFTSNNEGLAYLQQVLPELSFLKPGATLSASGWVKASQPAKLALMFQLSGADGNEVREYATTPHPGDGEWHKLEVKWTAPQNIDPNLQKIALQFRTDAQATMEVSDAKVELQLP